MSEYTHAVQRDVAALYDALGHVPGRGSHDLTARLIEEEAAETVAAIRAGDLIETIDGLCDLLCTTYGAAVEFGIDLAPFWEEVHRTNLAKAGGPVRDDGKVLKPPGWTPPQIERILSEQRPVAPEKETRA